MHLHSELWGEPKALTARRYFMPSVFSMTPVLDSVEDLFRSSRMRSGCGGEHVARGGWAVRNYGALATPRTVTDSSK